MGEKPGGAYGRYQKTFDKRVRKQPFIPVGQEVYRIVQSKMLLHLVILINQTAGHTKPGKSSISAYKVLEIWPNSIIDQEPEILSSISIDRNNPVLERACRDVLAKPYKSSKGMLTSGKECGNDRTWTRQRNSYSIFIRGRKEGKPNIGKRLDVEGSPKSVG